MGHLVNHPTVSRLVTIMNEADDGAVICKLCDFDRGLHGGAVIGVQENNNGPSTQPCGAPLGSLGEQIILDSLSKYTWYLFQK